MESKFKMRGFWLAMVLMCLAQGLCGQSANVTVYGTLCHELAHIYLGHSGTDRDHWWPSRIWMAAHWRLKRNPPHS
jgi:hypothetical protein